MRAGAINQPRAVDQPVNGYGVVDCFGVEQVDRLTTDRQLGETGTLQVFPGAPSHCQPVTDVVFAERRTEWQATLPPV